MTFDKLYDPNNSIAKVIENDFLANDSSDQIKSDIGHIDNSNLWLHEVDDQRRDLNNNLLPSNLNPGPGWIAMSNSTGFGGNTNDIKGVSGKDFVGVLLMTF